MKRRKKERNAKTKQHIACLRGDEVLRNSGHTSFIDVHARRSLPVLRLSVCAITNPCDSADDMQVNQVEMMHTWWAQAYFLCLALRVS